MMKPLAISRLRHVVEIQAAINTNTGGSVVTTWKMVATVRGEWTPLQGRALERGKSFGANVNTTVLIRFNPALAIDSTLNSLYLPHLKKRLVSPIAINDQGEGRTITIYCTEEH